MQVPCFLLVVLPHPNQCHQEHWQGGRQIFKARQEFIPKHLKRILFIENRHQMRSVVVFSLKKFQGQLYEQMFNGGLFLYINCEGN